MVATAIRVEGADELRRALRSIQDRGLVAALVAANESAAEVVVDSAMPDVPFRSGQLRRSVRASATRTAGRAIAATPYAAAVHWGRQRGNVGSPPGNRMGRNVIRGKRFLWEAAQREVPRIEPEYRDEIMRIIDAAIRSAR